MIRAANSIVRLCATASITKLTAVPTRLKMSTGRLPNRSERTPSAGAANSALTTLVAAALGVPRGKVSLAAGAGARLKRLRIEGDGPALAAALERLCTAA